LQDVYFLDLTIEPEMTLRLKQEIGCIESKKAESSLYSPFAGRVHAINESLLDDPTAINLDKYGEGWMFELESETSDLLTPEQYIEHLKAAWEVAQRTIKGQANA
jgi:glycine cleavage system H protein